jgi:hypothetical protein
MPAVLEECTTEEKCSVVRLLWAKGLNAKGIHIEMFPFCDGKCLSRKAVPLWWQRFRWWRSWNGGAEVTETTVKTLLCCGFRRTGKAMGRVYQCWRRICREINVIPRLEYHMFYVLCSFVVYLLNLPRTRRSVNPRAMIACSFIPVFKAPFSHSSFKAQVSLGTVFCEERQDVM